MSYPEQPQPGQNLPQQWQASPPNPSGGWNVGSGPFPVPQQQYPQAHVPAPGPPPMAPRTPIYVQTNHVLHLILSLITFGMWALFVWPWLAIIHMISNSQKRRQYDEAFARYNYDYWLWQQGQQR